MRDIAALGRAKREAVEDPEGFLADLKAGAVGTEGDRLFPGVGPGTGPELDDEDDSSDDDDDQEDEDMEEHQEGEAPKPADGSGDAPRPKRPREKKEKRAWQTLPKPQTVVRCPPINWSQYGVVGESLDRLHAEQLRAPVPGQPLTLGPSGTYEFTGGGSADLPQQRLVGIAAPYTPGRDRIEKKPKGTRR
jgi:hypothetical protein